LKAELSQSVSKMNEKTRLEYITKNNLGSILNKDGSLIDNSLISQQMNLKTTKDGLASTYNKENYSPKLYGRENELFIKPTNNELTQSDKDALLRINKLNKGYNRVASVIVDSGMIKKVTGQNSKAIELNGVIYIEQGADTESSQKVLATHELNHTLEGTKEKAKFDNFIIKRLLESEVLSNRFGNINDKFIETLNLYKNVFIQKYGKLENVTQEDIEKIKREINQETLNEVISQYVSENFFTNEAVIDRLASTEESLFKKIYNWIKTKIERFKIKSAEDRQVYDFLHKAESLYKKALENSVGGTNSVRYSIDKKEEKSYSKSTRKVVKYIPYSKVGNENVSQIRRELSKIYSGFDDCVADGVAIERGHTIFIVDSGKEQGQVSFGIRKKITISDETLRKEIVEEINDRAIQDGFISEQILEKFRGSSDKHSRGSIGQQLQKELSVDSRESTNNKERISKQDADRRGIKYSLSKDSEGKNLTEAQAEFFKDSQVRDENGNLLVVYHGTSNIGFTEFKGRNAYYTTDNPLVAKGYNQHRRDLKSLYRGYLNIKNPLIIDANKQDWFKLLKTPINQQLKLTNSQLKSVLEKAFGSHVPTRYTPADLTYMVSAINDLKFNNFDGIIIKNIYDNLNYQHKELWNEYIFFESNQFKNTDNIRPTFNNDIRFALSKDTEV